MTENMAKKIGLGLLVLGLLGTYPLSSYAGSLAEIAGKEAKKDGGIVGAQIVRTGGDEVAKAIAKKSGFNEKKVRAYSHGEAAANAGKQITGRVEGATKAAAERYEKAGGGISGFASAIKGAASDTWKELTGRQDEIASDVKNKDVKAIVSNLDDAETAAKKAAKGAIVYKLPNGEEVVLAADMTAVSGTMEGCIPMPVKLDQMKTCIFCPLFLILYNTAEAMATASFDTLAGGFKTLLLIGFALYIAYMTLKQVSSFTKQDAPKYITEALTMAFKVFFAWLILTNGAELYRLGLEPLLSGGIEFGQSFLTHQSAGTVDVASCNNTGKTAASGYFYSHNLYNKIDCFIRKVTQEIAVSQSMGSSFMCVARNSGEHWYGMWDLTMFFTGLIIWAFAWMISLAFSFYLIDSIIRLGIIGALIPFLVAAWPFKITQGYTSKGWGMFMNAFFTFVFMGLVISVNVELSAQAATGGEGGVEKVIELMNGDNVDELLEVMNIGLSGLIFLILCCVFGFKLCAEAAALAGQMGGPGGSGIGSKIGSAAAGAAKGLATRAGKLGLGAASLAADIPLGTSGNSIKDRAHNAFDKAARFVNNKFTPTGRAGGAGGAGAQGTTQNSGGAPDQNPEADEENTQNTQQNDTQQQNTQQQQSGGNGNRNQETTQEAENTSSQQSSGSAPHNSNNSQETSENTGNNSGNDEAAVNEAAQAAPRNTNDADARTTAEHETAAAKDEIAAAATTAAENASHSSSSSSIAHNTNGHGDDSGDRKGNKNGKGKSDKNDADADKITIQQLQSEIADLKKKLRAQSGTTASSGSSSDMAERLKKLEEELKRRGGSI